MTSEALASSYLVKATKRLRVLDVLTDEEAYLDVVREAQEIVELALKGMLRSIGVEPPRVHDVGPLVVEHRGRLAPLSAAEAEDLARISKWLRKEREFAFYGDVDLIPTDEYTSDDAERARRDARRAVEQARKVIGPAD